MVSNVGRRARPGQAGPRGGAAAVGRDRCGIIPPMTPPRVALPPAPGRRHLLRRVRDLAGPVALARLAGWGALGGLGGCAGWSPVPDHVEVSEARLLEQLATRFPLRRRVLDLVDLQVSRPRLRLRPEADRLETGFDVGVLDARWWPRGLQGRLQLGFGLRYDETDRALHLRDVAVQLFELDGVPAALAPQVRRLGAAIAELFLEDLVV